MQLLVSLAVEALLAACSITLLLQPGGHKGSRAAGWAVLSLTFCWSVILGCLITLHRFYGGA